MRRFPGRTAHRHSFDMDVFCVLEGGAGEAEPRRLGCGVTILERAWDYSRRFFSSSPSKALALSRLLRAGRYDVVHTHLFPADVIGRVAGRLAGIPAFLTSLGLRPDRVTIGTVGRPIHEKGHRDLLGAMPHIVANHPDVQFLIVGDGALRAELEARTATLGWPIAFDSSVRDPMSPSCSP